MNLRQLWLLYLLISLQTCLFSVDQPARVTFIPRLLGPNRIPAATALTITLRDGATGAGTIIWTYQTVVTATTGQLVQPHSVCGLNLVGTTNTAMTLEFSASLPNLIESVSLSGYNVN